MNLLRERGQPGDAERALDYFRASLETREKLWQADPDSAQAVRDIAFLQTHVGNLFVERDDRGNTDPAFGYFQAALDTAKKADEANPDNAQTTYKKQKS